MRSPREFNLSSALKMSARIALGVLPASVNIDDSTSIVTIQLGDDVPTFTPEVAVGVALEFMRLPFLVSPAEVPGCAAVLCGCQDYLSAIAVSWLNRKRGTGETGDEFWSYRAFFIAVM